MMAAAKKKKSGHAGRKEKAGEDAFWSSIPDHIKESAPGNLIDLNYSPKDLDPEFRLGKGLVICDENGDIVAINTEAMKKNGNTANEDRADAALQEAIAIKNTYPQHWGKKEKVSFIAKQSGKCVKTIKRYFDRLK
jgi:hypothetical protein